MKKILNAIWMAILGSIALLGVISQYANAATTQKESIIKTKETTPLYLDQAVQNGAQFNNLLADHESHYSHESHASHYSHQSHHSHYSGY